MKLGGGGGFPRDKLPVGRNDVILKVKLFKTNNERNETKISVNSERSQSAC